MNTVTIVSIIFIGLAAAWGYMRGMAKLLYKLVAFFLAILLAHFIAPSVSNALKNHTTLETRIKQTVEERVRFYVEDRLRAELVNRAQELGEAFDEAALEEALGKDFDRNTQIDIIKNLNIPEFIRTSLIENNNKFSMESMGVSGFYDYVSGYVAGFCVNAIAYITTWLVAMILSAVLLYIVVLLVKFPVIRTVDKFGGMVAGIVVGMLLLWLFFCVSELMSGDPFFDRINAQVAGSKALSTFHTANIFTYIIGGISDIVK